MAWDVVSKETNSLLSSAEVNQLQLNFNAFAAQDSGAPSINVNSLIVSGVASLSSIVTQTIISPAEITFSTSAQIASGGEISPDIDAGGLCLNQNTNDNFILTFKSTGDVNHGITSVAETDTYFAMRKASGTTGGLTMESLSEATTAAFILSTATTEDTTDDSSSTATIDIRSFLKSGTSRTALGNTANIFAVNNGGTTRFLIKGNGDIHATNTTITALDGEDDLALVENLKNYTGGKNYQHRVTKKQKEKLEEIGVIKGDFLNIQTMHALELGAITQMWKAVCKVAKKIGISEKEMHKLAMEG